MHLCNGILATMKNSAVVNETLAEAIQRELDERKWSRAKLARALEVDQSTVWRWEHGTLPSHPEYVKLARVFGWALYGRGRAGSRKRHHRNTSDDLLNRPSASENVAA